MDWWAIAIGWFGLGDWEGGITHVESDVVAAAAARANSLYFVRTVRGWIFIGFPKCAVAKGQCAIETRRFAVCAHQKNLLDRIW